MRRLLGSFATVAFLCAILVASPARAELAMRWTSVAGLVIEDGETSIAFDLVFTRPGLLHWAGFRDLVPEPPTIDRHLGAIGLTKLDALLVSHTHFDHAVDAPWIARKFGAALYGGPSLERIARANARRFGWNDLKFARVADRGEISVGRFRIRAIQRRHAAIFPKIGFHFLAGPVPEDFDFAFDDYREGETWCYVIEHPEGKIFVDQGGQFFDGAAEAAQGADFMAIGVSNKRSVDDWIADFIRPYRPKLVLPLHFDWFFSAPRLGDAWRLPGTDLEELRTRTARESPETKFPVPVFGERIVLPSVLAPVTVSARAESASPPVAEKDAEPVPAPARAAPMGEVTPSPALPD